MSEESIIQMLKPSVNEFYVLTNKGRIFRETRTTIDGVRQWIEVDTRDILTPSKDE